MWEGEGGGFGGVDYYVEGLEIEGEEGGVEDEGMGGVEGGGEVGC